MKRRYSSKDIAYLIIAIVLFVVITVFAVVWYIDGSAKYSTGRSLSPLTAIMALQVVLLQLRQMGIIGKNRSEIGKRESLIESLKRSTIVLAMFLGFDVFAFFFLDLYGRAFLILFSLTFTAIVFFVYRLIGFIKFTRESVQIAGSAENEDVYDCNEEQERGDL